MAKYRKTNMNGMKKVSERFNQDTAHDLKDGWNYFFVLPAYSDAGLIVKLVDRHQWLVCPRIENGSDCFECNKLKQAAKKGDETFIKDHKLKQVGFWNAIRAGHVKKGDPNLVKPLKLTGMISEEIVDYINEEDVDIANPKSAHKVGVKKTGSGMKTRYKLRISDKGVNISKYITPEFLEEALVDLDSLRATQPASAKALRELVLGKDADTDEDDDDFGEEEEVEEDIDEESDDELEDDGEEQEEESEDDGLEEDEEDEEPEEEESEDDELTDDEEEDLDEFLDDEEDEEELEPEPKPKKKSKKKAKKSKGKKKKAR